MATPTDTQKSPLEELLGAELLTEAGGAKKLTSTALKDKEFIALYFSASWCAPCTQFSPILKEFYKACAKKGKFEIIYISSDKSLKEFREYFGSMPWLTLPEGPGEESAPEIKNRLAKTFKIQGIPTLMIVDKNGKFVTASARDDITKAGGHVAKALEVIEQWKKIEPVPISEANLNQGPSEILGIIKDIIMFFARNPIWIIGKCSKHCGRLQQTQIFYITSPISSHKNAAIIYFYRRFYKRMAWPATTGDSYIEDEAPVMEQQEHSEF